jgi:hypothetical protein
MFSVAESYANERSSWTLLCWPYETEGEGQKLSWVTILLTLWNWGGRAEALLSDNSVDPMKLRGKGRSSPEWQFCWPQETEGKWQHLSLSDHYVDPMKPREKHRISPEWQQCWPFETEGEGHLIKELAKERAGYGKGSLTRFCDFLEPRWRVQTCYMVIGMPPWWVRIGSLFLFFWELPVKGPYTLTLTRRFFSGKGENCLTLVECWNPS